ncbi:acetate--CoA ligase family protein [Agromyces archimandritae]|uniref:Acetate--CoA ligase family protein n=1 Tax=Agromyces archimandritae TaxID=2781962 RepID=A0A975IQ64_9MICO|nr:acetate--CoA ligase family protein [Agromyces archimandritae]QTX06019.1 acetate--CoA ligase family protein [Agromyces archimandritae]
MTARDFTGLFEPRSVAILGASNDETKYGNWISVQALGMLGRRELHLVNRRGVSVRGRPPVRSLEEIGEPVDLVVITVPASGFEEAVEDSLAAGARAIVGVTAGFAELGAEGRAIQDRIVRRVRDAGAVLVGPNCLGVVDAASGLTLASNPMPEGELALFSQSGNMALELSGFLQQNGHGFSRFVSLGNQADVTAAELIDACIEHEATRAIAVYCEDFGDGRAFTEAASRAVEAGKPVILMTVGGSEASMRGAQSHTGALTSDTAVIDAACRAAGVVRVHTPRELADAAKVLLRYGVGNVVRRVAVIADGGGHGGIASDTCERFGLSVPEFSAALSERVAALLPPSAGTANPIDIAGAGEQDNPSFARVLHECLASGEVDAVLLTGYFGGYASYGEGLAAEELQTAARMAELTAEYGRPVLVHTMAHTSPAAALLEERGVPVCSAIEDAVRALAALDRARRAPTPTGGVTLPEVPLVSDDYWREREMLADIGIPFAPAMRVSDGAEARAAADRIGYPVVLKALGLLHKSDAGGVALGITDAEELDAALSRMERELAPPGFVVERMVDASGSVELILGVQRDPRFGSVVMVGAGGVLTEVLGDVAFELAPVDPEQGETLLRSLRTAKMLGDFRGRAGVDVASAAELLAKISAFAAANLRIREIEINPLLVSAAGAIALDARVILDPETSEK